jgi:hypothetical protein
VGKIKNLARENFDKWDLKEKMDGARTSSLGRLFQMGTTRSAKNNRLAFSLEIGTEILNLWPRRDLFWLRVKKSCMFKQLLPLIIL